MYNVKLERKISNILVPGVSTSLKDNDFNQLFEVHCLKKQVLASMVGNDETDFEGMLEALEVFIGTSNMDGYLLDISPHLDNLCDKYGVSN